MNSLNLTELNIFEIKIKFDTNIQELRNVVFEREMLVVPKEAKPPKTKQTAGGYYDAPNFPLGRYPPPNPNPNFNPSFNPNMGQDMQYEETPTVKPGLNKYPYFTADVEYPKDVLKKYTTEEKMKFFFDKSKFTEVLSKELVKKIPNEDYNTKHETINKNILTMLIVLFPTMYPQINNIGTSYDYIMNHYSKYLDINSFFSGDFAYLKFPEINRKVFTVSKVLWINDFLNHPDYNVFIKKYFQTVKYSSSKRTENNHLLEKYRSMLNEPEQTPKTKFDINRKIQLLEKENRKLEEFIEQPFETLQKFEFHNKVSSNFLLQNILEEKASKQEYNQFIKYLISFATDEASNLSDSKKEYFSKLLDVGITYYKKSTVKYEFNEKNAEVEICVLVDLIENKITEEVLVKQDCKFMGEYLGNEMEIYLNDLSEKRKTVNKLGYTPRPHWDVQRKRPMIVIGKEIYSQQPIEDTGIREKESFNNSDERMEDTNFEETNEIYDWFKTNSELTKKQKEFLENWDHDVSKEYNNPVEYIYKTDRSFYSLIKKIQSSIEERETTMLSLYYNNVNKKIQSIEDRIDDNMQTNVKKYDNLLKFSKILLDLLEKAIKTYKKGGIKRRKTVRKTRKIRKYTRKSI